MIKCKRITRELSAYLDKEIKDKKRQLVYEHLKICPDCKKEMDFLAKQDEYMKQLKPFELSPEFNNDFRRKVNGLEKAADRPRIRVPVLVRLPVPVMSFLVIFITFYMVSFSFALSAKGQDIKDRIASRVVEELVVSRQLLNPLALKNLCESYCGVLCNCAREQGVSSECVCGKCKN